MEHEDMKDDSVFSCKVWPTGMYEGHSTPEVVPFAANAGSHLFGDAYTAAERNPATPQWLRDALRQLRDDAIVLAQRINPTQVIPEYTGELGARVAEARRLHVEEHGK